ncbi:MAG TPA: YdeI/OmpD-associated family protein [Gemmatimonadales bacterium]|nr:YdeI/OmpD-associated family protein [Gemmatimonadales bacterium]
MKLGKTLYVKTRREWRAWLARHHKTAPEIWLIYYKKQSGKPRIPYNHAVEEALCYGWIDSILKPVDADRYAQRFSPRRRTSRLSAMNRERVRRLIASGRMTKVGLASIEHVFHHKLDTKPRLEWKVPADILRRLEGDPATWKNFQRFPESYKRIRIGWIVAAKPRPEVHEQRLRYFLKMTAQNKRFGMVQ